MSWSRVARRAMDWMIMLSTLFTLNLTCMRGTEGARGQTDVVRGRRGVGLYGDFAKGVQMGEGLNDHADSIG
jgi:hypothetical protein